MCYVIFVNIDNLLFYACFVKTSFFIYMLHDLHLCAHRTLIIVNQADNYNYLVWKCWLRFRSNEMFLVYSLYNYQFLQRCLDKSQKVVWNVIGAVDQGWLLRLGSNKNMPTNEGQYMYPCTNYFYFCCAFNSSSLCATI